MGTRAVGRHVTLALSAARVHGRGGGNPFNSCDQVVAFLPQVVGTAADADAARARYTRGGPEGRGLPICFSATPPWGDSWRLTSAGRPHGCPGLSQRLGDRQEGRLSVWSHTGLASDGQSESALPRPGRKVVRRPRQWAWGTATASQAEARGGRGAPGRRGSQGRRRPAVASACFLGSPGDLGRGPLSSRPDGCSLFARRRGTRVGLPGYRRAGPPAGRRSKRWQGAAPCGRHVRVGDVLRGGPFLCSRLSPDLTGSGLTTAQPSHHDLSLCVFQPAALGQRPGLPVPHGRRPRRALQQRRGAAAPPERPPGGAAGRALQGKAPPLGPARPAAGTRLSATWARVWNSSVARSLALCLSPVSFFWPRVYFWGMLFFFFFSGNGSSDKTYLSTAHGQWAQS